MAIIPGTGKAVVVVLVLLVALVALVEMVVSVVLVVLVEMAVFVEMVVLWPTSGPLCSGWCSALPHGVSGVCGVFG